MEDGTDGASAPAPRKADVYWSDALGRRICRRVAAGELLCQVLREEGMPTQQAVAKWEKERPRFRRALFEARAKGGRPKGSRGAASGYNEGIAREICERLCEGETLLSICRDPTMPSRSTVHYWRRQFQRFADEMRRAREIQAEHFCDLGMEMAEQATPETAYLTHVRLNQLRWTAGVLSPRHVRTKLVEPVGPVEENRVLWRHFRTVPDEVTGKLKVVTYWPNPDTGMLERGDYPGYTPPPHAYSLAGPIITDGQVDD
jgi:hypothetical protein